MTDQSVGSPASTVQIRIFQDQVQIPLAKINCNKLYKQNGTFLMSI